MTLEVTPAIPVRELVPAFGHYDEWIPMHFRDDPEDLAFDPKVGTRGQLRVRATLEEPGTRPPHGTVRQFALIWTPGKPQRPSTFRPRLRR